MHRYVIVLFAIFGVACSDAPSSPTQSAGQALTTSLQCSSCHGADLSGSESALAPNVYAANLTSDQTTGIGAWSDDQIAGAIQNGIDDEGDTLCTNMPRFTSLSNDQVSAIVSYLRTLPPIVHDIPGSDCEAPDLDDAGLDDSGVLIVTDEASTTPTCEGFADPNTLASCHACSSGETCQQNGCFGNYYCDLSTLHCVPSPDGC